MLSGSGDLVTQSRFSRSRRRSLVDVGPSLFDPVGVVGSVGGPGGCPRSGLPAPGLVKGSNCYARSFVGGTRLVLHSPPRAVGGRRTKGIRGKCCGMSKHAKSTATKLFTSIDHSRICDTWFTGFTLPEQEAMSVPEFKKVLARYFARVQRAWGERLSWYWAMEPQASGVLHVHCIMMWVSPPPSLTTFRKWNDAAWAQSTRCKHPSHQRTACSVERARSWSGVRSYLSLYLGHKKWAHWTGGETGRVHGIRNRHLLPIRPVDYVLTPAALAILRRAVAKLRGRRCSGMWTIDLDTGRRIQKWTLPVHPQAAREFVKTFARIAVGNPGMKIIRRRGRFWRAEVAWVEEKTIANGKESAPRIVPEVVDSFGCGIPSWSRGPAELQIRHAQAERLVEWAIREDLRRQQAKREFEALGVPF